MESTALNNPVNYIVLWRSRAISGSTLALLVCALFACNRDDTAEMSDPSPKASPARVREPGGHAAIRTASELKDQLKIQLASPSIGGDPEPLRGQLIAALDRMSPAELEEFISDLDLTNSGLDRGLLQHAVRALFRQDAAMALDVVEALPAEHSQRATEGSLMELARDPEFSLQLAAWMSSSNALSNNGRLMAFRLCDALAQADPRAALGFLINLPSDRQNKLAFPIVGRLAHQHFDAAMDFIKEVSDPALQGKLSIQVVTSLSDGDAALAYESASKLLSDDLLKRALPQILGNWIEQSPAGVLAILGSLPPDMIQDAISRTNAKGVLNIETLLRSDSKATLAALDKVVLTSANETTFQQVARVLGEQNLEAAFGWIEGFPESPAREALFETAAAGLLAQPEGE